MLQREPLTKCEKICGCLFVLWVIVLWLLRYVLEDTFGHIGRTGKEFLNPDIVEPEENDGGVG